MSTLSTALRGSLSLCLLITTPALYAQNNTDEDDPLTLVITASRTAQSVDDTLASVSVISRKDIERKQAQSVEEVLRGIPGVVVTNNGGLGKATSVFLRGTESDHVLVLIDGIKMGSATTGSVAFEQIPVDMIERIEVVRGPRSSLYGSEAIGGVIHIFTRKGEKGFKPSISIGAGSHDTYKLNANLAGGNQKQWFNLAVSSVETDGFNACRGSAANFVGCFTDEFDADSHKNTSIALRSGYRFNTRSSIDLFALHSDSETEFDGSFTNEAKTEQQLIGTQLHLNPTDNWSVHLKAGQTQDKSDNLKDGSHQSRFNTKRTDFSVQNDLQLGQRQELNVGIDYQNDEVDSTTDYTISSRDNTGIFAQYQAKLGQHNAQLSLRRDDNEQFGGHTTGSIAWGYRFANNLRTHLSYGTAFKAPSFNDLYFPNFGNPDLQPETSRSLELGLSGDLAQNTAWSLNLYQTQIDDLIGFDSSFALVNVDNARISGLEASVNTQFAGWLVNTSLTLQKPENDGNGANQGHQLPRRAERIARLDLDRQLGKLGLGVSVFAESHRFDDLANTRHLAGYGTLDLRAKYSFSKHWALQAKIANVLDKEYETAAYYNQDGRNAFVSLHYTP